MKYSHLRFILILGILLPLKGYSQPQFFRQYWMEYNSQINNTNPAGRPERPRVGDRLMSTHPEHWSRTEAQVNGLIMINIPDTIMNIDHTELWLELWGGHPGTAGKRFQINGGRVYPIPDRPTAENNCEYIYPVIPFEFRDLVKGNNAIQFGCDRGTTFWGHFIIDQLAVRCYLKQDDYFLTSTGLNKFFAKPAVRSKILSDNTEISLDFTGTFEDQIAAVHYFARYAGYDANGSENENYWHGYTHDRVYKGHLGTSDKAPFPVNWNTSMIPDQPGPMAVKALVEFKNGLCFWSDVIEGLNFPGKRLRVQIFYCTSLPAPFWSRNNQEKIAFIDLPDDISRIVNAEIHIRIWDGGEGNIGEPFTLNAIPYKITSGKAIHDLVYTVNMVDPKDLKPGINEIRLLSDTEHHGIEICWPGPALIIK